MHKTILVVEDDEMLAGNVCAFLARNGWDAQACGSAEEALRQMTLHRPDAVLADQILPRMCGIELVHCLREIDPQVKVIMMTGDDSAHTAVAAMKAGAYDYLTKPVALAELQVLLERAAGSRQAVTAMDSEASCLAPGVGLKSLIGTSPAMQELTTTIRQILEAEPRMTGGELPAVLIHGETGTGKELVARSLHFDGARRDGPFVEVNCASIPSHLLEAELFGHEKGAFTDAKERKIGLVESADGGTLFLDEIGEIDPALQAKLLKLLEEKTIRRIGSVKERKVNLRIISATNRDLEQMVREGKFRSDLYFRLRIISVKVPPLRARGNDVLLLARHFLDLHGRRYGKPGLYFSEAAERVLMKYTWPGNVRELRNMLEQTALLSSADMITPSQLALSSSLEARNKNEGEGDANNLVPLQLPRWGGMKFKDAEKEQVIRTLERTGWNVTKSAKLLGLSRDMMRYRIEKLGLERPNELE